MEIEVAVFNTGATETYAAPADFSEPNTPCRPCSKLAVAAVAVNLEPVEAPPELPAPDHYASRRYRLVRSDLAATPSILILPRNNRPACELPALAGSFATTTGEKPSTTSSSQPPPPGPRTRSELSP